MNEDRAIGMTVHEMSAATIITHGGGEMSLVRCTCGFEERIGGYSHVRVMRARELIDKHLAAVRDSITSRRPCNNCRQTFPVNEMEAGYGTGWICDECMTMCRGMEDARMAQVAGRFTRTPELQPEPVEGLEVRIGADGYWLCGEIGKVGEPGRRQAMVNVHLSDDTRIIGDVFRQLHVQLWPEGSKAARRFKLVEVK